MSDHDEELQLVQAGELGDRIAAFLDSDIGKYIDSCSKTDENEAIAKLLKLSPFEFDKLGELQSAIAKIQEDVMLSRKVNAYLADAIIRGQQADQLLMSNEETT